MSSSSTSGTGPSAAERQIARADIVTEGVKALVVVNGGGAVALLAFLQAVWDKNCNLARLSLVGISFMLAGVTFSLLIPWIRVYHSRYAERHQDAKSPMYWTYYSLAGLSILSFLVGWGTLIIGAFRLL